MTQPTHTYPDSAPRAICDVLNEHDPGNLCSEENRLFVDRILLLCSGRT